MDPEVRYCTTTDGVRIAYTVTGSGPALVLSSELMISHTGLQWSQHPVVRPIFELFAAHNTLVQFDPRGTGLSDRVHGNDLDAYVLDIESVVSRLRLDEFALCAGQSGSLSGIAYAARHPEHVRRFVLIDGFARVTDVLATPTGRALIAAASSDWELGTEAIGAAVYGAGREESRKHGAFVRACIGPDFFAHAALWTLNASPFLEQLAMPTLVVHHTGIRFVTDEMTRELASGIPDARLVTVEGLWADDPAGLGKRIMQFINDNGRPSPAPIAHTASGVSTVLFTDLVGHTEMMRRLGDARGREVLREHERITRDAIKRHGGTEIKTDGDSFMVSFGSVASAMGCAVGLQRAFAARNETSAEPLRVRMGLNAGEPVEDEGDLFGETVILAARIKDQAAEGEILIAEPVRHLLAGKGFVFADRGAFVPKGFEDAVRLFEVRWRE